MQNKYSWGLYNDPHDPRLIVPKMNPMMGWTLNIAHREARLGLAVIVIGGVIGVAASALVR